MKAHRGAANSRGRQSPVQCRRRKGNRGSAANLLRKRRWTRASSACSTLDPNSLDPSCRRRLGRQLETTWHPLDRATGTAQENLRLLRSLWVVRRVTRTKDTQVFLRMDPPGEVRLRHPGSLLVNQLSAVFQL